VTTVASRLQAIQDNLFARAKKLREENTRTIDDLNELLAWFTPKNPESPEIHGGFALCHFTESPEVDELFKKHKLTIRCVPLAQADEPGKCIVTGRPSTRRAVVAKAY